jgi:hypothetical protein
MKSILEPFKAARRVGTPLIAVRTPDPAATIATLRDGFAEPAPAFLQWDVVRGLVGLNSPGQAAAGSLGSDIAQLTQHPVEALALAARLPDRSLLFLHNAHRYVDQAAVSQAIWNLRDLFKATGRTLVLLCPHLALPAELVNDIWLLSEELPGATELTAIVREQYAAAHAAADLPELSLDTLSQAVDATIGLSAFPAEQAVSLSLSPEGLDLTSLWERKRQMIEQTPGLTVWRGGEHFGSIGGVENAKRFLTRLLSGRTPPRAVVFVDEIEKALAGASGDTSGVSQSFLGTLLSFMQDQEAQGCLFLGPPGAAKSAVAKAAGTTAGIPTIAFDLSSMKNSLVGESEGRLRSALSVVSAVSQGRALFLATCNSLSALAPEIRRRFKDATFFFDLPDAAERLAIWAIYLDRYEIIDPFGEPPDIASLGILPDDSGWTGADIRQCCELAWRLECDLQEAASYVVPVSRSAATQIEELRVQAHGRFLSASYPGLFDKDRSTQTGGGRAFALT